MDNLLDKIRKGWSSTRVFAEQAGVDTGGLSRILGRKANAEPDTLEKLALALGEDVAEFVAEAYMLQRGPHDRQKRGKSKREQAQQRYNRLRSRLTEDEEEATLNVMEALAGEFIAKRTGGTKATDVD